MPELKQIESGKLLCLEHTGPFQELDKIFKQIQEFTEIRRVPIKGDCLAIIYEPPEAINREQLHFVAAFELAGECTGDGEITVVIQSGMQVAAALHQGSVSQLSETYKSLLDWIREKGYRISGPAREYYLNGFSAAPEAHMIEIQIPIERPLPELVHEA